MTRVEKPWGYELIFAHTERYAGKILFVRQDARLSYQFHRMKEEHFYIQSGEIEVTLGDGASETTRIMRPGDTLHIPPGTRHRVRGIEDTLIFEVSSPELDDVVRIEDDYGRAPR
jgi:mannose-6-phosphate isomerase